MTWDAFIFGLGIGCLAAPALLLVVLAAASFLSRRLTERATARLTAICVIFGMVCAMIILGTMLASGSRKVVIELGNWVAIPSEHYHFQLRFIFDRLSIPFVLLTYVLCGVVGKFASRYLHREIGFTRFFLFYSFFFFGMVVSSLAGTIETLFLGWEFVGLSSALLIAYFHQRTNPVQNGLHVWAIYRLSDAALVISMLTLHHATGGGDFDHIVGRQPWPLGNVELDQFNLLMISGLLLIAAAGKSALIPFCGWLPRAMEGPTPSSAIFYGALSAHLGAFLLLRFSPLIAASWIVSTVVILIGLATACLGAMSARVQADVKSAIAFSSLTQVGIILVEIGLGLPYVALIHIIGHACLRTLQFLRAPSVLHDYNALENAIGSRLSPTHLPESLTEASFGRQWTYRFSLERGFLDEILRSYIVAPFMGTFRWFDKQERRWTQFLSGESGEERAAAIHQDRSLEELT
ncbi:oxidoreductase [Blastopirellula sp. JC732]|uniref:Oxidoreductase n=1 Tax=Blastopirellula sediminis TaxID=2894196 RepID=A0A9X1ML77_9BACT|nr:proton-conducting transporter membrane subunit [Blastopirellula sediminis]MCC9628734.1 oxidoreductase [Blastopirellula sediminis]